MCTAISFIATNHYFGRNLDLEYHFNEAVIITPRNYPFVFREYDADSNHYAIIGIGTIIDNYPLYYDAVNEHGLAMAGLNFPDNAKYNAHRNDQDNIAPFELIPYILCRCNNVAEAEALLRSVNLLDISFRKDFPLTPLHWIISDKNRCIVVEPTAGKLMIYDNPVKILTNNPPFDYHMYNLTNYLNLSSRESDIKICSKLGLKPYSRGLSAFGLPGDLSSSSRFVRAAFTLMNATKYCHNEENVEQFFQILGSVTQQAGCVKVKDGDVKTVYASCCNTDLGIYYYRTYLNSCITAVNLHEENVESAELVYYPLRFKTNFVLENKNQRM